ncbi:MAG TPA: hypothetical protein HA254_05550 [Candidatus Diapherotrites archaeon]|uniref:50S ribosomal protein L1 n=1 Tax=Candidatus Iainarchaeum sp. TaxID=3101447 RepID=A0A7J4IX94_9ARCH|nr:hypothetical protein [Candidatus Diapherotrites archaeon]
MDRKNVIQALQFCRQFSNKRKFDQSFEMILNFKGIDFKKAENRIELDVKLPHPTGKQGNVKALVFVNDPNFAEEIKSKVARVILATDVPNLKKKDVDLLLRDYNVFLAEGPAILAVAKYLGQQLAPKGKMPKPIQPTVANLEQALRGASTFTKVTNKKGKFMPVIHTMVGKESFQDETVADNFLEIYNSVVNVLPNREGSIKSAMLKLSMGIAVKVGVKYDASSAQSKAPAVAEAKK